MGFGVLVHARPGARGLACAIARLDAGTSHAGLRPAARPPARPAVLRVGLRVDAAGRARQERAGAACLGRRPRVAAFGARGGTGVARVLGRLGHLGAAAREPRGQSQEGDARHGCPSVPGSRNIRTAGLRVEDLARVEHATRIERLLHRPHRRDLRRRPRPRRATPSSAARCRARR